jgi:alpha-galactosidase
MLIDTCASGGRRLDLETLRRSVPLWRSDYPCEPVGSQCMSYALSSWIPYHGSGAGVYVDAKRPDRTRTPVEVYAFWSQGAPSLVVGIDSRLKDNDCSVWHRVIEQRKTIAQYYYGDFYPLTSYSLDKTAWIGWQFNCPESQEGMVQLFRRPESNDESLRVRLQGLESDAVYTLTNLDTDVQTAMTGREFAENGLSVAIKDQPGFAVFTYKKKQ